MSQVASHRHWACPLPPPTHPTPSMRPPAPPPASVAAAAATTTHLPEVALGVHTALLLRRLVLRAGGPGGQPRIPLAPPLLPLVVLPRRPLLLLLAWLQKAAMGCCPG